jgi:hypothetical protein
MCFKPRPEPKNKGIEIPETGQENDVKVLLLGAGESGTF